MLNYSFVDKNESKSDNSSSLETAVVINCILNAPLMLTSITGNALVLAAILRTPSLRSVPSTVFLCSLASTDFLVGLVVQPVYIAIELCHLTGEFIFKAIVSMSACLCGVSLATITAISNESKSDNLKMDNTSSLETVVVINCILNAPLMLTSITGNALVLAAILRTPSLRSVPSTIFLCSLASTDFLVGLVVQPVYIAMKLRYLTGGFIVKATFSMSVSLCGVSLATITAISVDRLLALHYHMTYPNLMTTKRALYASATFTMCFVKKFKRKRLNLLTDSKEKSFNISVNVPDSNNMIISKKRALKTFIYFICMIFCYLPYLSYSLLRATSVIGYEENWSFAETVVFVNSSVNPFLYCWCNREIRTSAVKVLRKMMCKQTKVASELEG
ncbi:unnamed protein product [Porites lobata]|uniref:G-protein coupled receptors family 1 profile domain-containing protein n=1 Tax=Porites lobata TaxID=104759 RepID=A0ABN8QXR3_9CNID|nr:unnamed protein product [Porites lobata]